MDNPFLKTIYSFDGAKYIYLDSSCSLNKLIIKKLPYRDVSDADEIEGKTAEEIFSTRVITKYIKTKAADLNIDLKNVRENDLPKHISMGLLSDNNKIKNTSNEIVKKFGYRLGMIFLTLKTGLEHNREARLDWNNEHWEYWANLKKIILVGGLSNDKFGEGLQKYATELFNKANVEPYEIMLFNNASHLGIMGAASQIKSKNSTNIVFDFGQTNIKRSIVKKEDGVVVDEKCLPSIESKYMELNVTDLAEKKRLGLLLHKYIVEMITATYKEVAASHNIGDELVISIANYNKKGQLNPNRGGYAKLSAVSNDYARYLSGSLYMTTGRNFDISLIHDGSAIALHFKDIEKSVCISVGTAFGVGFSY